MVRLMIIDTDAGTDDAMALFMFLAAEKRGEIKILAITTVTGNTVVEHVNRNVLRVLQTAGRADIPVFSGCEASLVRGFICTEHYHGVDGFGDADFSDEPIDVTAIQDEHAVHALCRVVRENSWKVTLVALGPLTNVALAAKLDPTFRTNVKELFIMGGNTEGKGNVTLAQEFNFHCDPDAAYVVLHNMTCPTTIVPWEMCLNLRISPKWRSEVLGSICSPAMDLMNKIEAKSIIRGAFSQWTCCDSAAAAVVLDASIVQRSRRHHVTVELQGLHTRGQMIVDHYCHLQAEENVVLIDEIFVEKLKKLLLTTFRTL